MELNRVNYVMKVNLCWVLLNYVVWGIFFEDEKEIVLFCYFYKCLIILFNKKYNYNCYRVFYIGYVVDIVLGIW